MKNISGYLRADVQRTGDTQIQFASDRQDGNTRAYLAKNFDAVREDLVRLFALTEERANALIAELKRTGHVDERVTVNEQRVRNLFQSLS